MILLVFCLSVCCECICILIRDCSRNWALGLWLFLSIQIIQTNSLHAHVKKSDNYWMVFVLHSNINLAKDKWHDMLWFDSVILLINVKYFDLLAAASWRTRIKMRGRGIKQCACPEHKELSAVFTANVNSSRFLSVKSCQVTKWMLQALNVPKTKPNAFICIGCFEYAKTQHKVIYNYLYSCHVL